MRTLWPLCCTTLLLAVSLLSGCQKSSGSGSEPVGSDTVSPSQAIITATVDTLPILQQDPEYQKLAQKYTTDNLELSKQIKKRMDAGELSEAEAAQEYLKRQKALNDKWMKNTNDFIQTRHAKMRAAVKAMAEEKKIDLVLIHSKVYRSVEYGAFDITQDVLMKVYGSPLGGTPTPGGTP